MIENLVIVESPTKAKTIKRFLGKDFEIKSCNGHIRDLDKKGLGIDIENDFKPKYILIQKKNKLISALKNDTKKSKYIWLATDEDREGEAIAWHLSEVLKLDKDRTKRVVFHEITKNAVIDAIKNPRTIETSLVNAQQARRLLDRIIGFKISPILWKKIKPALSAGRVQSVAVKLIVEREKKIEKFISKSSFRIIADFKTTKSTFKASLSEKLVNKNQVVNFFENSEGAKYQIKDVNKQPIFRKPSPPHTTSSLQQEANLQLGFSVSKTMLIAQQLYESGHITYMRTDSFNISNVAVKKIASEITSNFGKEYLKIRKYSTKSRAAQEAHEAIRPTNVNLEKVSDDKSQQTLYNLIRKRTLASQMANAKFDKKTITISISGSEKTFIATGETLLFDGFLKIYNTKLLQKQNLLPQVKINEILSLNSMLATQIYSSPPPRFNEASLVKKLEELGIGRPSTYAPIIANIQKREYIEKKNIQGTNKNIKLLEFDGKKIIEKNNVIKFGAEKRKFNPTDIGVVVTEFLSKNFEKIMNYNFTAQTEENLDKIALGEKEWKEMLADFYNHFQKKIKSVEGSKGKFRSVRLLGTDPISRNPVYAKIGKFGPMIQIGESGESKNLKFAGLLPEQTIQSINLEEALKLFEFPKEIGTYKNKNVIIGRSRYGAYIKYNNKHISIPKNINILKLNIEKVIPIIEKNAKQNLVLKTFDKMPDILIKSGRYGNYISYKNKNYKIPKPLRNNPENLSIKDCMNIINNVK